MTYKQKPQKQGFTLIELLTVISIIAFMSGMFLVAYRGAAQESNIQKTRSTIQKISEVLNARMDEYASYPMALRLASGAPLPTNVVSWDERNPILDTVAVLRERARLLALRDVIRMEMPDHPDDLKYTYFWWNATRPLWSGRPSPNNTFNAFLEMELTNPFPTGLGDTAALADPGYAVKNALTSRAKSIMTKLSMTVGSTRVPLVASNGRQVDTFPPDLSNASITPWDKTNANAELLFLIVEGSDLNGSSATELFGKSEVSDTDNDGLSEFIDAFGNPIRWIRWPAGFEGATRYYPDMLNPAIVLGTTLLVNSEPYDRLGSDPGWGTNRAPGFGLSPLVISAGPDEKFGIRFRDLDRYSPPGPPPGTMPPPAGPWQGIASYSCAEAPFDPATPNPYGLRSFTDPWFPRNPATIYSKAGEILPRRPPFNVFDVENSFPVDTEPVSGDRSDDNISNFEGTGVSL
jgi:prepilin-type N-terminal cleavage/methylation domain-containing protein